jgi:hypothetical protein
MPSPDIISIIRNRRVWVWSVDYPDPALSRSGDAPTLEAALEAVDNVIVEARGEDVPS